MQLTLIRLVTFGLIFFYSGIVWADSIPETRVKHRWSISLSGGYGFPFAKDYIIFNTYQDTNNVITYVQKKGSLGEGVLSTALISYQWKEHFKIELGGFTNRGREIQYRYYESEAFPEIFNDAFGKVNTAGVLVGFSFSQRFNRIEVGLHNYFLSGFFNKGFDRRHNGDDNDDWSIIVENTGNVSLGSLNRLSLTYYLTDRLSLGIDGFIMIQSWSPARGEFTEWVYNGQDGLPNIAEEYRTFEYSSTYPASQTNPYIYVGPFTYALHSCGAKLTVGFSF